MQKGYFYLGLKKVFLTDFLKDYANRVLKITIVNENFKPVRLFPIKWLPFKVFVKSLKSPVLIANVFESAVSGL